MFERESLSLMYDIVINLMKIIWLAKLPLQIFLVHSCLGLPNTSLAGPSSITSPRYIKTT